MTTDQKALSRRPLAEFVRDETTGGIALACATVAALIWANAAPGSYDEFWSTAIGPDSPLHLHLDLHAWVNDALMTVFFFVVGLEIKRELVVGELKRPRDAAMPLFAAVGGMVVPAAIYASLNAGRHGADGWGIPIATDIAFVLGALSLLGRRAPSGLRLFLLAVAIIDDIGAIIIIALFYTDDIDLWALLGAAVTIGVVLVMRSLGVARPLAFVLPAIALWMLFHESGIHATIAGVVLGLLTPARPRDGRDVLGDLEHRLHPYSTMMIVPLFALANAGVALRWQPLRDAATSRIAWGVLLGLVVGKTVGLAGATLIARRLGIGALPPDVEVRHVIGAAMLAGIGFTVALFVADLSFATAADLTDAKLAILCASVIAGSGGAALVAAATRSSSRSDRS